MEKGKVMPNTNKFYAIIPSRYASTRFPAKALVDIGGKPLFWHAYKRAHDCGLFHDVYLATDDERIEKIAKELNVPYIHTKPEHPSGTDRVLEAAQILGLAKDAIIANVQGDEPFLTKDMFTALLKPFENPQCTCTTLGIILDKEKDAQRISSPNQVKIVLTSNGEALYFSRSPIPFDRDDSRNAPYIGHVGIYAFRHDILDLMANLPPSPLEKTEKLEQLRLLENGIRIQVCLIKNSPHGVDTPEDLEAAKKYYDEHPEFWT